MTVNAMQITDWRDLGAKSEDQSAETWAARQNQLSPQQRKAVWAWQPASPKDAFLKATDGPLARVPFVAKDLFHYRGTPTLSGGIIHTRAVRRTSCLVSQLESLGAVLMGKTHLHEFAYGLTGENPHYGNVEHPRHVGVTAGGSSSGSAAAVAAGVAPFALGTDTAGSLRVPAAYCGLFSWRGRPGESWINDAFPLAPSFDTAGWLTSTAADCAKLWELIYSSDEPAKAAPIGAYLPASALGIEGPAESVSALNKAAAALSDTVLDESSLIAKVCRDVALTYSILQSTEAYAVHQNDLDRLRSAYGKDVWGRIDRGRNWTAEQMDRARLHALKIRAAYDRFFTDHDFLVTPISLRAAPPLADNANSIRENLLNLNTHVSIAGRPAISIPVPLENGFTLGIQVVFNDSSSAAIPTVMKRCETC